MVRSQWEGRVALLGARVRTGESVLDVGAGTMALREYIPADCLYVPIDKVGDPPIVLLDLESWQMECSLPQYDVAVLSGVLEHLVAAEQVLRISATIARRVLFSYDHSDPRGNQWKSSLTHADVERIAHETQKTSQVIGTWNTHTLYEWK